MKIGIHKIGWFFGKASLDLNKFYTARGLEYEVFQSRGLSHKTISMPWEDPVTNAVNSISTILSSISNEEVSRIGLVVTATESGMDFRKSISTYFFEHLPLPSDCRAFEIKQACYAGVGALQTAYEFVFANPDKYALVCMTDVARTSTNGSYEEPTQGQGAISLLITANPSISVMNAFRPVAFSRHIMDTYRPDVQVETGDREAAYMNYVSSFEKCYLRYAKLNAIADMGAHFDYLLFPGIAELPHHHIMRGHHRLNRQQIEHDFAQRVSPPLWLWRQLGNLYSATVFSVLLGALSLMQKNINVGLYAYGSGSCAEFFDMECIFSPTTVQIGSSLNDSISDMHPLSLQEYELILSSEGGSDFGIRSYKINLQGLKNIYENKYSEKGLLVLDSISDYTRNYIWT